MFDTQFSALQDLYILCHSSEISPPASLRDIKHGGCVMTCASFEKRAGRELSKKWKVCSSS
jgi:hypothetical protein